MNVENTVFRKLQEHLDKSPVGYPKTESGVEMKLLEKVFAEDEAGMYLNLSLMLETPEAIAGRIGQDKGNVLDHTVQRTWRGIATRGCGRFLASLGITGGRLVSEQDGVPLRPTKCNAP